MPSPPRVFLSYSHDSRDHQDRVLALADRLRRDGIDAELDQYEVSLLEAWPEWTENRAREADFVLVISTETYRRRFDREVPEGEGLGVKWEGTAIRRALYEAEGMNEKYLPVVFAKEDLQHIPDVLRGMSHYDVSTEEAYEALYRHLTDQPSTPKPELGRLRRLPARRRSGEFRSSPETSGGEVADHAEVPTASEARLGGNGAIGQGRGAVAAGTGGLAIGRVEGDVHVTPPADSRGHEEAVAARRSLQGCGGSSNGAW